MEYTQKQLKDRNKSAKSGINMRNYLINYLVV